jgi:hypothetical protein
MKTIDFTTDYKEAKRDFDDTIRRISFAHTLSQEIEPLLPKQWKIELANYKGFIKIKSKAEGLTADRFDKLLSTISRNFNIEPSKHIDKKNLSATYGFWRDTYFGSRHIETMVIVYVETSNSESCDVVETTEEVKTYKLSGYCKAISEKNYLQNVR